MIGKEVCSRFILSRWAIVDVDYRGSTGFGKAYRDRLNGAWGVADTEDVANCVRHLVKDGLVDSHQVAIAGGSAGMSPMGFRDVGSVQITNYLRRRLHRFECSV